MSQKRRLSPQEWAMARRRWEGSPQDGFAWLAAEIESAWGVAISRPAVRQMASKPGAEWVKGAEEEVTLPSAVSAKVSVPGEAKPAKLSRTGKAKVSRPQQFVDPQSLTATAAPSYTGIAGRSANDDTGLTSQEEQFAGLIAFGLNQSDAYRLAFPNSQGWKPTSVHEQASKLAATAKVTTRTQDLLAGAAQATQVGLTMVLREYLTRLQADPRELTEIRVVPCRFCHGIANRYQFTDGELDDARDKHEERRLAAQLAGKRDPGDFNPKGGGGYSAHHKPNPECPRCAGAGEARSVLKDSRGYSAGALSLFVSAKESKEGIEVKVNDRDTALQQIARHLGFYEADKDPAASVQINYVELDAMYDRAMAQAKAAEAHAKGRMARLRAAGVDVGNLGDLVGEA